MQALTTLTLCDTRGKRSKTLFLVVMCLVVLLFKFILGGLETPLGTLPIISAGEFGLAAAGLIGVWVMRDNKAKELDQAENLP
jgi:heme A synthase